MTVDLELYPRFVAVLQSFAKGEVNAMTGATLARALGLPKSDQSRRHLRACAQHAVASGHLICASNRGYYVPATRLEADAALSRLSREAFALLERTRRARALVTKAFGEPVTIPRPALPLFEEIST